MRRLTLIAILLCVAAPLGADEDVDLEIAYVLDALEAPQSRCGEERLAGHDGRRVVCGAFPGSFNKFKSDWEMVMLHARQPLPMETAEPWTFRNGAYARTYTFGAGREMLVEFAPSSGAVLFAYVEQDVDPYAEATGARTGTLDRGEAEPPPRMAGFGGVSVPRLIAESRVEPVRSLEAQTDREVGTVTLEVVVTAEGLVREVVVLKEQPEGYGFGEAARDAVLQWRFEPALHEGEPVPVVLNRTVEVKQDPPPPGDD